MGYTRLFCTTCQAIELSPGVLERHIDITDAVVASSATAIESCVWTSSVDCQLPSPGRAFGGGMPLADAAVAPCAAVSSSADASVALNASMTLALILIMKSSRFTHRSWPPIRANWSGIHDLSKTRKSGLIFSQRRVDVLLTL